MAEQTTIMNDLKASGDYNGFVAATASLSDYFALLKPRVMSLAVFTALAGMVIAPGSLHPVIALTALLAIALGAGAAGALNMWYDADIDALMQRTAKRPIPRGRVPREEALSLGVILAGGSVLLLGLLVNAAAGLLLALSIGIYIFVYTFWLKRRTSQNIVIGGAAGALPPVIGWAAVTGSVSYESLALFLIIFLWTPPHFWALALYRSRDYARAGIPMLPVVKGAGETRWQIFLYTLLLLPAGFLPVAMQFAGWLYGIIFVAMSAGFLYYAYLVLRSREGFAGEKAARELFAFSILYLFAIFSALLVEHGLGLV
jgi:protoheme IX farnesyltransferase